MIELLPDFTRLHSGAPWWLVQDGLREAELVPKQHADVVVIGAGITGALVTDALTSEGLEVLLIDRREPGTGSTAASTALLLYELDLSLVEMIIERVGATDAVRAWQLSDQALDQLAAVAASLPDGCCFEWRPSFYLATRRRDIKRLRQEADIRAEYGFDTALWTGKDIQERYGFAAHAALRTTRAAAINPLYLTRALLDRALVGGAGFLARTTAQSVERHGDGLLVLTDRGPIVTRKVVLAIGYEIPALLRPTKFSLTSTYALVTEPIADLGPLRDGTMLWESSRNYHYLRPLSDGRVMIGGEDLPFTKPSIRDSLLPRRTQRLEERLQHFLPQREFVTAFSWVGTFGETADGLPIIGEVPEYPGVYYALGYGGNGITFSAVAAEILRDLCMGRGHADAALFRADR